MKRMTVIACVLLVFSGAACAQANPTQGGVLNALLGPNGVVLSLVGSLQQTSLQPTLDALVARHPAVDAPMLAYDEDPLVHQTVARQLNQVLSALLRAGSGQVLASEAIRRNEITFVTPATPRNGIVRGARAAPRSETGLETRATRSDDISPRLQAARLNEVALPGL